METCGRKEVVMKNLSNYLKSNIYISLKDYLYGFLEDMIYVHSYQVDSHWRRKRRK